MVQPSENGATLKIKVQPKSSRNQVDGYKEGVLRLRVTAPPEAGKANAAVISLLAQTLGIPKNHVRIVRGHASREKLVEVESLTPGEIERRLPHRANGV